MDVLEKKESKETLFTIIPAGDNPSNEICPPEKKSPVSSITSAFIFAFLTSLKNS